MTASSSEAEEDPSRFATVNDEDEDEAIRKSIDQRPGTTRPYLNAIHGYNWGGYKIDKEKMNPNE